MKHTLSAEHKEHLRKVGISEPADAIEIPHEEYERHKADWQRTLPDADEATLHKHVLAHAAWKQHSEAEPMTSELAPTVNHVTVNHAKLETRVLIAIGFLILMVLLFGGKAHAQFSHINYIDIQNQGSDIGFFTSPFTVNFTGAGVTCANSSGTVTCTVTGGSITNNPGGSNTQIQFNDSAAFGGSAVGTYLKASTKFQFHVGTHFDFQDSTDATKVVEFDASGLTTATTRTVAFPDADSRTIKNGSTTGQIPIWNGSTGTFDVSDPLVQGTQAAASTTIPNPVVSGGSDYGGTAAVRVWKVDSSGNGYAVITTLPALPAGTNVIGHVIADSGSTTAVTSLPALPAGTNVIGHVIADSGSTTAVTGNVASTVADGANVTLGAKADAKSTATDTTAVTFMQVLKEISFMEQTPATRAVTNAGTFAVQLSQYTPASGRLPVDGSGVTQPVSGTITGNQGTAAALSAPWPVEPAGPGSSNTITALAVCDKHIIKNSFSSSGTTLLIAAAGASKVTRICAMALNGASTTANTVKLIYGTHVTTDCDTGATDLSVAATIQAATSTAPIGMVVSPPSNVIWDEDGNTNQQVCVNMSAAQAVNLEVWYSTTN